jgi:hypothetical protein
MSEDNLNEALADAEEVSGSLLDINLEDAEAEVVVDADTECRLVVIDARLDKSKKPGADPYLRIDWDVADYDNAPDIATFNTLPTGRSGEEKKDKRRRWNIRQKYDALQAPYAGQLDPSDLVGLEAWAILGVSESDEYGEQNYIKKFVIPQ